MMLDDTKFQSSMDSYYPSFKEEEQYKVHRFVAKMKLSYTSEIAKACYLDRQKVDKILDYLLAEGALVNVPVKQYAVDPRLQRRLEEFQRKGIVGYPMFLRMRLVAQNPRIGWSKTEKGR